MIFYATPIEKFKIGHATSTFTEMYGTPLLPYDAMFLYMMILCYYMMVLCHVEDNNITKYHHIITKYHHIMKHLIIRQLWRSIEIK